MFKSWSTVVLLALLVIVQAQIWFGSGGRPYVVSLESQLAAQLAVNTKAKARNDQLAAEVVDLKVGLEVVEEKARMLGMIKPNEVFVQIMPAQR